MKRCLPGARKVDFEARLMRQRIYQAGSDLSKGRYSPHFLAGHTVRQRANQISGEHGLTANYVPAGKTKRVSRALTVLVAEDDPNDALLLELAFGQAGLKARLHFVSDGKAAIHYLRGEPPFKDRTRYPWPDWLVLDLKMPRTTGFDVLEWLRQCPDLNPMGVAVLSGSHWQADIERAYALGANFYCTKPSDFKQLVGVAERLKEECSLHPPRLLLRTCQNSPSQTARHCV
jgi:CheY-like chemotaxis protein